MHRIILALALTTGAAFAEECVEPKFNPDKFEGFGFDKLRAYSACLDRVAAEKHAIDMKNDPSYRRRYYAQFAPMTFDEMQDEIVRLRSELDALTE
jgi:hypothetical protein